MFTDLASIRSAVKTRLTPVLPSTWGIEATLEGTINAAKPVLYVEFVGFDNKMQGANLPYGQVAARFNLIITDPKTDTGKAEDAVDEHVHSLVRALDPMDDIYWEAAEKKRMEGGPMAWTIRAYAYTDTTTTEE